MKEWDLSMKIAKYLDVHLVFPLFEFLAVKGIYSNEEVYKGRLELLSHTKMMDYYAELHESVYPDKSVPEEILVSKEKTKDELNLLNEQLRPLYELFEKDEVIEELKNQKNADFIKYLATNYPDQFHPDLIPLLYSLAKYLYDCGVYLKAASYLHYYSVLTQPSDKNFLNCLWGKLASEILTQNWDTALLDLNRLKEFIEAQTNVNPVQMLHQRSWLLHWSLFVFFNHTTGRDRVIDLFLCQQHYLNTLQTTCPHLLRYLTTSVIANIQTKQHKSFIKDLVRVVQQESYAYSDPIIQFIECLFINFDFKGAQQKLRECEEVINNDFFLIGCKEDFIHNARLLIFETFCRLNESVSINMLAGNLNMTDEDAEKWIVNLIRNAKLNAKIDFKQGRVIMDSTEVSPYQQLIDKTKQIGFRTQFLFNSVEKRMNAERIRDTSP